MFEIRITASEIASDNKELAKYDSQNKGWKDL
jgi:hypothetical protein